MCTTACYHRADTGRKVAATGRGAPVLHALRRRIELTARKHRLIAIVAQKITQVARETHRQVRCARRGDYFPVRVPAEHPGREVATADLAFTHSHRHAQQQTRLLLALHGLHKPLQATTDVLMHPSGLVLRPKPPDEGQEAPAGQGPGRHFLDRRACRVDLRIDVLKKIPGTHWFRSYKRLWKSLGGGRSGFLDGAGQALVRVGRREVQQGLPGPAGRAFPGLRGAATRHRSWHPRLWPADPRR